MKLRNILVLSHFFMLPFIIYLIFQKTAISSFLALFLLFISVIFDALDKSLHTGSIHEHNSKSFLHPVVDKVVVFVLLFVFLLQEEFSAIILGVFVFRDVVAGIIRLLASREDVQLRGLWQGKVLTSTQFALVFALLIKDFLLDSNFNGVFFTIIDISLLIFTIMAVIFSLWSIVNYVIKYSQGIYARKKRGERIKKEEFVILANPKSRGYRNRYRRHLLRLFARRRKASLITLGKKDFFNAVTAKVKDKHVIIAGGDGTFESALNFPLFKKKALGFFPLGAGNAFYSYFYKGKRFEYLRSRFHFRKTEIDVLEVSWDKGSRETLFLSLGVDAEVIRSSKQRTRNGLGDYVAGSWDSLLHAKGDYDFLINIDNKQFHWGNCVNLTLGKVPYYGFAVRSLLGNVNADDGLVYGLGVVSPHLPMFNKLIRLWALLVAAMGLKQAPLIAIQGKSIEVRSKVPFALQAGGEFLGYTEWAKVKVKRKQKVLVI